VKYLILNQLGTPSAPTPEAVGVYLKEFLMDQNVIALARPFNDILVKIGIVPRRKFSSAEKYKKIWTPEGSPLAVYTQQLRSKMQELLGPEWKVITAMRYGNPSIADALIEIDFKNATEIVFIPLYPQFAQATVGSAIEKFKTELKKINQKDNTAIRIVNPFFEKIWYTKALAESIRPFLNSHSHLLLSYHGIPLTQERRSPISYYQQCLKTTELIIKELAIDADRVTTSFQSRVGLAKWLEPSTTESAEKLALTPEKELVVVCPSFVADCLETAEEIGMELRSHYLASGGKSFTVVPCLNSSQSLVDGLKEEIYSKN
jgi:ferrochelatase